MAIKIVCDRCGKTINGTTYYTFDIHAEDVRPIYGISSFDTVVTNATTSIQYMVDNKPCYCKQCVESIQNFINNGLDQE